MYSGIMSGLRVIDLTQNVAGPYCTQVLGDYGADVIKIERPGRGDDTRAWRPPEIAGRASTFIALNRNKKSVCIDLDTKEGVAVLHRLAATADIFIHSMKPGSAEARNLGYEQLSSSNPQIIYCGISAFGSIGPLAGLPGYDPLMQAFTGVMSTTGNEGDRPVRVGVSLIDIGTGIWAAQGVTAALLHRHRAGKGSLVEANLMETGLAWMTVFIANYLATGTLPRKLGSAMAMTAPYELFEASDGEIFIAAGNDNLFRRVCVGLGQPEIADDPRFATNTLRVQNRSLLRSEIEKVSRRHTVAELVRNLRTAGAPCSELNDVASVMRNEQVLASGLLLDLPIADAPAHKVVGMPLRFNGHRSDYAAMPPDLGADTDIVLREAGFEAEEIETLKVNGAIA